MTLTRNPPTIVFAIAAVALFGMACTSVSRDMTAARTDFKDYVAQCTARHGYSPEDGSTLGPYVLGANEREWRGCVYQGVEQYLVPSSLTPDIYRRAIAEDRKLTDNVSAGQMTRGQRAAQLQELLSDIDRIEEANKAKIEQMQSGGQLVKQEMERQQDPMRRVLMLPLAR